MNSNHNPDTTQSALRVLIVDDSSEDAILVAQILRNINFPLSWERMENENDYILQLQTPPDLIPADYGPPQFNAVQALDLVQRRGRSVPFIVVSGTIGGDAAAGMMKRNATDYVLKDRLSRLRPAVTRFAGSQQNRLLLDGNRAGGSTTNL